VSVVFVKHCVLKCIYIGRGDDNVDLRGRVGRERSIQGFILQMYLEYGKGEEGELIKRGLYSSAVECMCMFHVGG
jgi:hypothetical protein